MLESLKENEWECAHGIKEGQTILGSIESDFPELQDRNTSSYLLLIHGTGLKDLETKEL